MPVLPPEHCLTRLAFVGVVIMFALPTSAKAPSLAMLDRLEKGRWELRDHDNASLPRKRICVKTGRELIQLRHRQPGCRQFVVQDEPNEVTIQYTCRGNGFGRTSIRRESDSLVQIRSQGVLNGSPFLMAGEARREGDC